MARVVLHIGTHKTATTAIQDFLARNREALARQGIVYPALGPQSGHHGLMFTWHDLLPPSYRLPGSDDIWETLSRQWADKDVTLLLSSEEFSRGYPSRVDMADLRRRLSAFEEVRVICVLRNQAALLQSVYQEVSRQHKVPPIESYVNRSLAAGHASGVFLSHAALYDFLLEGFAPEEILLLSYEQEVAAPEGIIGRLLAHASPAVDLAALGSLEQSSNASSPPAATLAAVRLAHPGIPEAWAFQMAAKVVQRVCGSEARTSLLHSREVVALHDAFAAENDALVARRRDVQPDFFLAPVALRPETITRDKLGGQFWMQLARELYAASLSRP
ncbi:hypothetical protein RSWS8N_20159 (plasmid) [Cereibacter sphaeroides WS8N]|uniref:sulfotransferase domain-containing protein n=1 Tax=Cereibacter sphaeroides TaxID=1063 RepID=UPI00020B0213|nr:sulfotransferase domain-containing protein [Cereibacter sphaeroides]EGJ19506.1 hypothetical protein RSWS8N_20159 [Cereibacter sphaeroides WS8N]